MTNKAKDQPDQNLVDHENPLFAEFESLGLVVGPDDRLVAVNPNSTRRMQKTMEAIAAADLRLHIK